ncbi:glycosyltransferase family 4 protein [Laspinema palackyanum]|uniref:glycosyltransferase family 4 protein n=1 Tax=Laspinema palackyanum TaxID=3231601 RepID=UPI00345D3775|nr:glycosyltransferase family 4 protein [Laspinema sp. D2c]
MKILLIITRSDAVGGAQLHVRDLALRLLRDGYQVMVLTGVRGKYNDLLEKSGIQNVACPTFKNNINPLEDWQTLSFIKQTISQFKPDLVATHSSKAGILGRWASKQSKVPCIFTAHGWSFAEGIPEPKRTIYQLLEQWTAKFTDRIICVSEYDRQLGIKAGIEPNRLVKIHNGISDISPELIASPGHSNPVRIVMVARFEPQKDHRTMLMALQTLKEVELDLLGDGPDMETYKIMARELGIADRVNFLGFCSNVTDRLTQYQIFALMTNWEGFPISTLEAMRAGLPTVVSDVNGCSEAIIEGETGYSIPQGDVETLRTRLKTLISDSELRVKMGQLARKRYEKEYTFEMMYQCTIQTYQKALTSYSKVIHI